MMFKSCKALLIIALMIVLGTENTWQARILALHTFGGNQYLTLNGLANELADRGHEVVLAVSSFQKISPSEKFAHWIYHVPDHTSHVRQLFAGTGTRGLFTHLRLMTSAMVAMCESLLSNTVLQEKFKGFDILINTAASPCGILLSQLLKTRRIVLCSATPRFLTHYRIPAPLSFVPQVFSGNTDKMTFLQRVRNLVYYVAGTLIGEIYLMPFRKLMSKYNIAPPENVELVLIGADFALEYPQPLLPNTIMVGPFNVRRSRPLPTELETFVNSSGEHGAVIVAFGSNIPSIADQQQANVLAQAFGRIKQKVIWKQKGYIPPNISSNIKIMDWLPQNDLLAHPQVVAFVSHVGHNSLYEAAYWRTPLVMVPLFSDQFDNALRAEHLGLGLSVNIKKVTAEELHRKLERVISDPSFKMAATRISRIMKDRGRWPLEGAADWIEYVLRHGGANHLQTQALRLTWYQYYMLDVATLLIGLLLAVVMVTISLCRCLCWLSCNRRGIKIKKE